MRLTQLAHGLPGRRRARLSRRGHAGPGAAGAPPGRLTSRLEPAPSGPIQALMSILPIIEVPDALLRAQSTPLETVDDDVSRAHRRYVRDDVRRPRHRPCRGPGRGAQAARDHRPAGSRGGRRRAGQAARTSSSTPKSSTARSAQVYNEGCLSIPDQYAEIQRPDIVRARWIDEQGKRQEGEFDGLMSVCLQHEVDHLDGVLFIDYLSRLKRDMVVRRSSSPAANADGRQDPLARAPGRF